LLTLAFVTNDSLKLFCWNKYIGINPLPFCDFAGFIRLKGNVFGAGAIIPLPMAVCHGGAGGAGAANGDGNSRVVA
jgi:hypothetical protein